MRIQGSASCGLAYLFSALCKRILPTRGGTDPFPKYPRIGATSREKTRVDAVRHVLDLQLCGSVVRSRGQRGGFPLSLGQEIKTQSRWLAEFCRRVLRALRNSVERRNTSKTDVPSANVAKFGPVAIRERARFAGSLSAERSGAERAR